jgi:hypothetical protein
MERKRSKVATWWPQYLEAKPLELFMNLEESATAFTEAHPDFENKERHPATPAEFRKAYPEFAPDSWWDSEYVQNTDTSEDGQKLAAALMKQVEESGIDTRPLTESKKAWRVTQANLRDVWDRGSLSFPLDMHSLLMFLLMVYDRDDEDPPFGAIFDIDPQSPYQQALVWLNSQPWRARTCKVCKRRFIASWPSNEHCSQHCAFIALREFKRKFREDHAEQYNRDRRKARAKAKLENRSPRANRKNLHKG